MAWRQQQQSEDLSSNQDSSCPLFSPFILDFFFVDSLRRCWLVGESKTEPSPGVQSLALGLSGWDRWTRSRKCRASSSFKENLNGNPLQYSCLGNPMDGEAWWATVHGVTKSQTRLSDFTFTSMFILTCFQLHNNVAERKSVPPRTSCCDFKGCSASL